jgi:hypothetical protein
LSMITFEFAINLGVISSDLQPFSKRIKPNNGKIDKFLIIELLGYVFSIFQKTLHFFIFANKFTLNN